MQLSWMRAYSLTLNGALIAVVEVEKPAWLPVRPCLKRAWLAVIVDRALRHYFSATGGPLARL